MSSPPNSPRPNLHSVLKAAQPHIWSKGLVSKRRPRRLIFSYLDDRSLLNMRLVSRDCAAWTGIFLPDIFQTTRIYFSSTGLLVEKDKFDVKVLRNIGQHVEKLVLVYAARSAPDSGAGDRDPRPIKGVFGDGKALDLRALSKDDEGKPIATIKAFYLHIFSLIPNLRHLALRFPAAKFEQAFQRTTREDAIIEVRAAVEESKLNLRKVDFYPVSAMGLWHARRCFSYAISPGQFGLDGRFWGGITRLEITLLPIPNNWEEQKKIIAMAGIWGVIKELEDQLKELHISYSHIEYTKNWDHGNPLTYDLSSPPPQGVFSKVFTPPITFGGLTELSLRNIRTSWMELGALVESRASGVVQLVLEEVEMLEGGEGWRDLYKVFELERAERVCVGGKWVEKVRLARKGLLQWG
ncbi:hypothetical protein RUND412_002347 [Rhizina undulata]